MRVSRKAEAAVNILDAVIRSRKAIRAFKSEPVPKHLLTEILDAARAAPSNFNSQPWRVYLLAGKAKDALGEAITRAHCRECSPRSRLLALFESSTPLDRNVDVSGCDGFALHMIMELSNLARCS
jgi:predicted oxidoreductase (fatty acid repression mutant protein)